MRVLAAMEDLMGADDDPLTTVSIDASGEVYLQMRDHNFGRRLVDALIPGEVAWSGRVAARMYDENLFMHWITAKGQLTMRRREHPVKISCVEDLTRAEAEQLDPSIAA